MSKRKLTDSRRERMTRRLDRLIDQANAIDVQSGNRTAIELSNRMFALCDKLGEILDPWDGVVRDVSEMQTR